MAGVVAIKISFTKKNVELGSENWKRKLCSSVLNTQLNPARLGSEKNTQEKEVELKVDNHYHLLPVDRSLY